MSAVPLVRGGAVQGHSPDPVRVWGAGLDRVIRWRGLESQPHPLPPVPGDAPILAFDAWSRDPLCVCDDGGTFRHNSARGVGSWYGETNILDPRNGFVTKSVSLVLAGVQRTSGGFWHLWAVSSDRRLAVTNENLAPPEAIGTPIPGDVEIRAVHLVGRGAEVLTADGRLWAWSRGWIAGGRMPTRDVVIAGVERVETRAGAASRWWALDRERQLWVVDRDAGLDAATQVGRVPGSTAIVAGRLSGRGAIEALLSSGELVTTSAVSAAPRPAA